MQNGSVWEEEMKKYLQHQQKRTPGSLAWEAEYKNHQAAQNGADTDDTHEGGGGGRKKADEETDKDFQIRMLLKKVTFMEKRLDQKEDEQVEFEEQRRAWQDERIALTEKINELQLNLRE